MFLVFILLFVGSLMFAVACCLAVFLYTDIFDPPPLVDDDGNRQDDAASLKARGKLGAPTEGDFGYPIEETPRRVRNSEGASSLDETPKSGAYKIVCSAAYYGKTFRSEGELELRFSSSDGAGWEIEGFTSFKSGTSMIQDGFLNREGQMYWVVPSDKGRTIYRGCYDFDTSTMHDGEFKPKSGPRGRIIRLEFLGKSKKDVNVEMVDLTKSKEDTNDLLV